MKAPKWWFSLHSNWRFEPAKMVVSATILVVLFFKPPFW